VVPSVTVNSSTPANADAVALVASGDHSDSEHQSTSAVQNDEDDRLLPFWIRVVSKTPEFAWVVLTSFFVILVLIARYAHFDGKRLPTLELFSEQREQYLFGVAALCLAINTFNIAHAVALLMRNRWHVSRTNSYAIGVALLTVSGSGVWLRILSGSDGVLLFCVLGVPCVCSVLYGFIMFRQAHFCLLDPAGARSPPESSFWIALPYGGLTRYDYTRLGCIVIYSVCLVLFSSLFSILITPSWYGWSIGLWTMILTLTGLVLLRWFGTFVVDRWLVIQTFTAVFLLSAWALGQSGAEMAGSESEGQRHRFVLITGLVYLCAVLLFAGFYQFYQDRGRMLSVFFIRCVVVALLLLGGITGCVFMWVGALAGGAVAFTILITIFAAVTAWAYEKHGTC